MINFRFVSYIWINVRLNVHCDGKLEFRHQIWTDMVFYHNQSTQKSGWRRPNWNTPTMKLLCLYENYKVIGNDNNVENTCTMYIDCWLLENLNEWHVQTESVGFKHVRWYIRKSECKQCYWRGERNICLRIYQQEWMEWKNQPTNQFNTKHKYITRISFVE